MSLASYLLYRPSLPSYSPRRPPENDMLPGSRSPTFRRQALPPSRINTSSGPKRPRDPMQWADGDLVGYVKSHYEPPHTTVLIAFIKEFRIPPLALWYLQTDPEELSRLTNEDLGLQELVLDLASHVRPAVSPSTPRRKPIWELSRELDVLLPPPSPPPEPEPELEPDADDDVARSIVSDWALDEAPEDEALQTPQQRAQQVVEDAHPEGEQEVDPDTSASTVEGLGLDTGVPAEGAREPEQAVPERQEEEDLIDLEDDVAAESSAAGAGETAGEDEATREDEAAVQSEVVQHTTPPDAHVGEAEGASASAEAPASAHTEPSAEPGAPPPDSSSAAADTPPAPEAESSQAAPSVDAEGEAPAVRPDAESQTHPAADEGSASAPPAGETIGAEGGDDQHQQTEAAEARNADASGPSEGPAAAAQESAPTDTQSAPGGHAEEPESAGERMEPIAAEDPVKSAPAAEAGLGGDAAQGGVHEGSTHTDAQSAPGGHAEEPESAGDQTESATAEGSARSAPEADSGLGEDAAQGDLPDDPERTATAGRDESMTESDHVAQKPSDPASAESELRHDAASTSEEEVEDNVRDSWDQDSDREEADGEPGQSGEMGTHEGPEQTTETETPVPAGSATPTAQTSEAERDGAGEAQQTEDLLVEGSQTTTGTEEHQSPAAPSSTTAPAAHTDDASTDSELHAAQSDDVAIPPSTTEASTSTAGDGVPAQSHTTDTESDPTQNVAQGTASAPPADPAPHSSLPSAKTSPLAFGTAAGSSNPFTSTTSPSFSFGSPAWSPSTTTNNPFSSVGYSFSQRYTTTGGAGSTPEDDSDPTWATRVTGDTERGSAATNTSAPPAETDNMGEGSKTTHAERDHDHDHDHDHDRGQEQKGEQANASSADREDLATEQRAPSVASENAEAGASAAELAPGTAANVEDDVAAAMSTSCLEETAPVQTGRPAEQSTGDVADGGLEAGDQHGAGTSSAPGEEQGTSGQTPGDDGPADPGANPKLDEPLAPGDDTDWQNIRHEDADNHGEGTSVVPSAPGTPVGEGGGEGEDEEEDDGDGDDEGEDANGDTPLEGTSGANASKKSRKKNSSGSKKNKKKNKKKR